MLFSSQLSFNIHPLPFSTFPASNALRQLRYDRLSSGQRGSSRNAALSTHGWRFGAVRRGGGDLSYKPEEAEHGDPVDHAQYDQEDPVRGSMEETIEAQPDQAGEQDIAERDG